ncbi:MAG: hypothetical protein PHO37_15570 [Kiritimatiellae bacterium]|nr:hypothetical protein [Kiritimatiellia bacterium]
MPNNAQLPGSTDIPVNIAENKADEDIGAPGTLMLTDEPRMIPIVRQHRRTASSTDAALRAAFCSNLVKSAPWGQTTGLRHEKLIIFATETLRGTEGTLGCFWGRKIEG